MGASKRVVVAMSGGVDSSVTAAVLLEQGYEVIGVTMQIQKPETAPAKGENGGCPSRDPVEDAGRVAEQLGIPFHVLDFRDLFEEKVVRYFTSEYLGGRTPNPCIACNRYIKFGALLTKTLEMGADYMATGHYARLGFSSSYGRYTVRRPLDRKKDQTYVLYGLTQEQIARTLMPLGEYTKEQVRKMAAGFGLQVADKAESQDLCFIMQGSYRDYLREKAINYQPGPFLNLNGEIIGTHRGIPFYTIGQRRGLNLAAGERLYVVRIDAENNTITLGPEKAVFGKCLRAEEANLILFEEMPGKIEVEAQVRYNGRPARAILEAIDGSALQVCFLSPQRSITPGQSVVFYLGDYLVGGATIEESLNNREL